LIPIKSKPSRIRRTDRKKYKLQVIMHCKGHPLQVRAFIKHVTDKPRLHMTRFVERWWNSL